MSEMQLQARRDYYQHLLESIQAKMRAPSLFQPREQLDLVTRADLATIADLHKKIDLLDAELKVRRSGKSTPII